MSETRKFIYGAKIAQARKVAQDVSSPVKILPHTGDVNGFLIGEESDVDSLLVYIKLAS